MRKNVLVLIDWLNENKIYREMLEKNENYSFNYKLGKDLNEEDFENVQIIIGNCKHDLLNKFNKLEWVQLQSAGTDGYTTAGVLPENTKLTNATGTYGLTISEYLIGSTLMMQRRFLQYVDNQRKSLWQPEGNIQSIYGSTFLIIGLGDIGTEFAKRVKAMGGYTIGVKRTIYGDEEYVDECYTTEELKNLLHRADVIVSSVPNTPQTKHMYNKEIFTKMKSNAVFINVGRGNAVVLDDLCDALDKELIFGAVIDVTDPEPLPNTHRAWQTSNLFITPHVSGNYSLEETKRRFIRLASQNLENYKNKENLISEVNFSTGYRMKKI